ncbi:MAG: tetratricopeptide repeat protein [Bacteroidetes bacterium]|nr:tetratricopeptide repeat protein [Bacteroidota bacterium]
MSKIRPVYCYLIIIAVTYIVFYNSLSNEFVFDDENVIVNNPTVQNSGNIPKFFTGEEGFHKVIGKYYRPIVSSTYAIDYSIWGLDPYGFHLTNVIIHIISCLLLFRILSLLFHRYKYRNIFSLFGTLIFAVHPIHTEAVSWVSGRTDSIVTMFFFASFLFYIMYTGVIIHGHKENSGDDDSPKNYLYLALSLVFYCAGLLSKEMIVTMPAVILLYDLVYRKKGLEYLKKNYLSYLLFIIVTVVYVIIRESALSGVPDRDTYLYFYNKGTDTVFWTMIKTIPVYFRLLFAPFGLLYHYNGVLPDSSSITDFSALLSLIFILVMLGLSFYFYKKDSIISFCILFFLLSLLPVMNIAPTMNLMAERFLYMTSFALAVLITHLFMLASNKRDTGILLIGIFIIIVSLAYLTYVRNEDWKTNETLYSSAIGYEGSVILVNEGNMYSNSQKYSEAKKKYKRAIELRDNNVLAHHNLGLVYMLEGKLDSAEMRIKRGIAIDTLVPDGYYQLATIYNMEGKKDEAIAVLEKLQNVYPDYKESASMLEKLKAGGNTGPDLNPVEYQISFLQQQSYRNFNEKKYDEAITDLKKLIELNKDSASKSGFLNNIAMCYTAMKDDAMTEKYFLEALKYSNKNVNALNGLVEFYLKKNDRAKAIEYLKILTEVNPGNMNSKNMLDSLMKIK